jgi:hypothetical protein
VARDAAADWRGMTELLAVAMPDVVARLLDAHASDGRGYCRTCTTPGRGTPYTRWPCALWTLASRAAARRAKPLRVIPEPRADQATS